MEVLRLKNEMTFNGELCTWFDKLEFSFLFFPFIEKLYPTVCTTVPASLQARGCRPRDCNFVFYKPICLHFELIFLIYSVVRIRSNVPDS